MDQRRQGTQSTKKVNVVPKEHCNNNKFFLEHQKKTQHCFATIIEPTHQIFTDQTGRFLVPSSKGHQYIMVLYDVDSNVILVEPFCNREAKTIKETFQKLHGRLLRAGLCPKFQ